jgi:hypothetical protein
MPWNVSMELFENPMTVPSAMRTRGGWLMQAARTPEMLTSTRHPVERRMMGFR